MIKFRICSLFSSLIMYSRHLFFVLLSSFPASNNFLIKTEHEARSMEAQENAQHNNVDPEVGSQTIFHGSSYLEFSSLNSSSNYRQRSFEEYELSF